MKVAVVACGQGILQAVNIAVVMAWPRGAKHGYVLVQQAEYEEHLEDVISPLVDMANIRQLVSELLQRCVILPLSSPRYDVDASCIKSVTLELPANPLQQGNRLMPANIL